MALAQLLRPHRVKSAQSLHRARLPRSATLPPAPRRAVSVVVSLTLRPALHLTGCRLEGTAFLLILFPRLPTRQARSQTPVYRALGVSPHRVSVLRRTRLRFPRLPPRTRPQVGHTFPRRVPVCLGDTPLVVMGLRFLVPLATGLRSPYPRADTEVCGLVQRANILIRQVASRPVAFHTHLDPSRLPASLARSARRPSAHRPRPTRLKSRLSPPLLAQRRHLTPTATFPFLALVQAAPRQTSLRSPAPTPTPPPPATQHHGLAQRRHPPIHRVHSSPQASSSGQPPLH